LAEKRILGKCINIDYNYNQIHGAKFEVPAAMSIKIQVF
jgi:hypothetical protein